MQSLSKSSKRVIFLLGFLSICNAFYISLGLNLRLFDIMFYITPIWGIINIIYNQPPRFSNNINGACVIISLLFLYLTISGFTRSLGYTYEYYNFFLKYFIHKVIWIMIYLFIYLLYGKQVIKYFLLGLTAICVIHVGVVIIEWISLVLTGNIIDYSFLNSFFIQVEEKKYDVFNQGFLRPTGFTMDPNYATGYAGIAFIYCEKLKKDNPGRTKQWTILQLACLLIMALLFSRTALFSITLTICFSMFAHAYLSRRKYKVISPAIALLIFVGIIGVITYFSLNDETFYKQIIQRLSMKDGSTSMRSDYLYSYFNQADLMSLVFGTGTSSAGLILSNILGLNVGQVWSPESNYITFAIEQGLFFLIVFFLYLAVVFFRLLRREQIYAYIFLYINLIGLSYNFLGDRIYLFLLVCFTMYAYDNNKLVEHL